jgi:beta-lactamase regulating signal transducer with metallopeptidase domain
MLAAIAAMILRRDSAATRHLVWLLAIVALLVLPVLSAMLPQWRVLPTWVGISPRAVVVDTTPPSIAEGAVELPQHVEPVGIDQPSATEPQSAAELPESRAALVAPEINSGSVVSSWNWLNALPLVWAIGFCVLIVRLIAARLMLWNTERHATVIWSSSQPGKSTHDPLATAFEAACAQFEFCRPVTLLLHSEKTIPVVWGIVRCRLLLPVAARQWTGEQLRSVLLHELAHLKRHDTLAQLLTQIACALYTGSIRWCGSPLGVSMWNVNERATIWYWPAECCRLPTRDTCSTSSRGTRPAAGRNPVGSRWLASRRWKTASPPS